MPIAYTVTATIPDEPTRERYVSWILDGHAQAVVHGGALGARVLRLDAQPGEAGVKVEVRYEFASREALERYVRDVAPGLRAEGLAMFPPESGVRFDRRVGEVVGGVVGGVGG